MVEKVLPPLAPMLCSSNGMMYGEFSSLAPMMATVFLPCLPVSLPARMGSLMERVYTAEIHDENMSAPSWKKGRFSGYDNANVRLASIWVASDSIWLKSGLYVRSMV